MYPIQQGNTEQALLFLLVSSADHLTGLTGATPTVLLSKNGAAFAAPAGAVTEIGSGWYALAANAADASALGPLLLHATATGADPQDTVFVVVDYDPLDAIAAIQARLLSMGRTVTFVGPVATSGDVTLRQGIAYPTAHGRELEWAFVGDTDLTGATLELIDAATGTAIGTPSLTVVGDTQTVSVELTAEESADLPLGSREYILRATFETGEPIELTSGTLAVKE
jgi:hypothetical protein